MMDFICLPPLMTSILCILVCIQKDASSAHHDKEKQRTLSSWIALRTRGALTHHSLDLAS